MVPIGNPNVPTIGMQIREMRRAAGLTQSELAHLIGVSRVQISRLESGHRNPSPRTERTLREVLNASLLSSQGIVDRYSGDDDFEQIEESSRDWPKEAREFILRSLRPRDMSQDTEQALAELRRLQGEGPSALVEVRVIVQSRHHASDWQVMNGMAALTMYEAFPRTFYLKLLSEDYHELGVLAPMMRRIEASKGRRSAPRRGKKTDNT